VSGGVGDSDDAVRRGTQKRPNKTIRSILQRYGPDSQSPGPFLWGRPVGRTLLEGEQAQICEARGRSVQRSAHPLELLAYPMVHLGSSHDWRAKFLRWYELMSSDVAAAKAFYANVVGWSTEDMSMPADLHHTAKSANASRRNDDAAQEASDAGMKSCLDKLHRR